jgi:exodeoxyribonuclease-3
MAGQLRILSFNVNGVRAVSKKEVHKSNLFLEWLKKDKADILCIQETKAWPEQLTPELLEPRGYHTFWEKAEKKGYSGVATFTKEEPLSVTHGLGIEKFDSEGRTLVTEHADLLLFNVYFPNGKASPERLDYKMEFYNRFLEHIDKLRGEGHNIVVCGDFNTAHKEIDLARPRENKDVSGFLLIERNWLDELVEHGYVDTFRHVHGDEPDHYSWWDYVTRARERNVGWRIDYFFINKELLPRLKDAFILQDVFGSDHCPVGITLELP